MAKKPTPEDIFYDHLTLGLMGTLAKLPRVCNVNCEHRKPCEKAQIVNWEQRNTIYLPEDMKKFYLSTDGFLLQWSYQYAPKDLRRVGFIHIPRLHQITLSRDNIEPLINLSANTTSEKTLAGHETRVADDVGTDTSGGVGANVSVPILLTRKDRWGNPLPNISTKTKIFEINNVNDVAKVCMLYEANCSNNPKFYLFELNAMKWIFLSDTFSEYLRMAIAHLGLPFWELCFSNIGLPSWTEVYKQLFVIQTLNQILIIFFLKQLFMLLAPHLLEDYEPRRDRQIHPSPEHPYNIIDTSVFRIKPKGSMKNAPSRKNVS
ncbi:tubulin polyglutamylase complex subunit 2 isoform X1 [Bactrocera tryoni]|uniref:tubulin polyglutamylase complex subunit 2 isoform X1 n=1 Tax=Bactrocera tryoni TaxID=59916 RepID=UPI001A998DC9|nr:tubulin polyglutamylase complex subunit 2 isoform X1 [Bactrocera tryoni]